MPKLRKGFVHLYTGNGKGKTSAAIGLVIRAAGRGLKSYIIQFIKGGFDYGELYIVDMIPNVTLKAFGRGKFITAIPPDNQDVQLAQEALMLAAKIVKQGEHDIVVLDEVNVAIESGLIDIKDVLGIIKEKPKNVELVLTGRYAKKQLVDAADYVTEMIEVKHPFKKNEPARMGIEY